MTMQHVSTKGLLLRFNLCLLSLLMIFCSGAQAFAQGSPHSAPQDPVARDRDCRTPLCLFNGDGRRCSTEAMKPTPGVSLGQ